MMLRAYLLSNTTGIHYTVRIFIGTTLVWLITQWMRTPTALWAIISVIIVTEPQMRLAWLAFRTRMINTLTGSVVGFSVLAFAGPSPATLILGLSFTALLSTYINRGQQGWRIAPITTALVISAGMMQQSAATGMSVALSRTFEVFLGSTVALLVTVLMARIWLPPEHMGEAEKK
jgi:uncharacterized membrane protein YccC